MNLSSGFITRPIATALLMVAVVVLGIVSYRLLPVAALPNIDTPTIQVTAQMPGADPQTVASSVTTQLERQFGQIPGLSQMTSSSGTGFTSITLQFDRSRTVDSAAKDVQAAINATQAQLPISLLTSPIYRKTNPADTPILLVSMTSDVLPIMTVSDYAYSILAQKVSQVPGVGLVTVGGNLSPSIRIQLNPAQLANMNFDFETVRLALANLTVVQPTGLLYGSQQAAALQTNDQLMTAQGFDDAIVAYRNGAPIRIRDIGRAIKAPVDTTLGGWLNGKPAVLLSVFRQPGANVMSAVAAIKKALPQLRASLPPGIDVEIVSDRTQTIAASLADVRFTLLLTIALVVGVIALFLRRLWATVIPAISVPISLIGTFAVMYALGYSLDNLSLMALTIAVGFVVDDAIVMVENIVTAHGGWCVAVAGRARWRRRDRLHHPFDFDFADCGLHSALPDGRRGRTPVSGIRGHRRRVDSGLGARLADAHAHALRKIAAAQRGMRRRAGFRARSKRSSPGSWRSMIAL